MKSRFNLCILLSIIALAFFLNTAKAQISTSFWFDVPEVTRGHVITDPGPPATDNKVRVYLHISAASSDPTTVRLEMPAETGFPHQDFDIPGDGKIKIALTRHGLASPAAYNFDWFAVPEQWTGSPYSTPGNLRYVPQVDRHKYIENVLDWAVSDMSDPRPYFNRTNKGVHLYSVASTFSGGKDNLPFKAFIEVADGANRDLMVLKGESAEGTQFSIPMQNNYALNDSRYNKMLCSPYRSFNITATADNTLVEITVKNPIWIRTNGNHYHGKLGNVLSAGTHKVVLDRGQTCIVTPHDEKFTSGSLGSAHYGMPDAYQVSREANKTLEGSYVRSVTDVPGYSGGKIVISYQEQLLNGWNPDIAMDQLIPNDVAGYNYGIIRGRRVPNLDLERAYVVATEDGTVVNMAGFPAVSLSKNQQTSFRLNGNGKDSYSLSSNKPIQVFHLSGTDASTQGQRAGGVVPPLSTEETCIGSKVVDFSRSMDHPFNFILNVAAFQHPTDPTLRAIGHFKLQKSVNGSLFADVTGPELAVQNHLNNPANWKPFPSLNAAIAKWQWLSVNTDALVSGNPDIMQVYADVARTQIVAYRLINTANVFQLGVLNGHGEHDALYGYFSDFRKVEVGVQVKDNAGATISGGQIPICRGDNVELDAGVGLQYARYSWTPPKYLSSTTDAKVKVLNPKVSTQYTVTVTGYCDFSPTAQISIEVSPIIEAYMSGTSVLCGTGEVPIELSDLGGANKLNLLLMKELTPFIPPSTPATYDTPELLGNVNLVDETYEKILNFTNLVSSEERYLVRATLSNNGCTQVLEHNISQFPRLKKPVLGFLGDPYPIPVPPPAPHQPECAPLTTQLYLLNNSVPADQYPAGTKYRWRFFDGTEEIPTAAPQYPFAPHTFENNTSTVTTLVQRLYVSDADGNCKDSADFPIEVAPRLSVNIDLNPAEFCENTYISMSASSQGDKERIWTIYNTAAPLVPLATSSNSRFVLANGLPAGTYKVKLVAKNAYCSKATEATFIVHPQPTIATLDATPSTAPNCYPYKVQLSSSITNAVQYEWQLLSSPGQAIPRILETGTLTPPGTTTLTPTFPVENSALYEDYRYIRLRLTTDHGCTAQREVRLSVPPNLEVSFFGGDYAGCPNGEGKFTPNIVANVYGALIPNERKRWYVDGNEVVSGANPDIFDHELVNESLTAVKTYIVKYTVTTAGGCEKSVEQEVTVYPRLATQWDLTYTGPDGLPRALGENAKLCTPVQAQFNASGPPTLIWEFTDGSQLEGSSITKSLENKSDTPLAYTVKLNARNAYCVEKTPYERHFELLPEIRASFLAEVLDKCNPVKVKVTNTSAPSSGLTADWNVQGGVADPVLSDTYIFSEAGTRSIGLRMTNNEGCYADAKPFILEVPPLLRAVIKDLSADEQSFCAPGTVTFTSRSTGARTYAWDFGDGTALPAGTDASVSHEFHNITNAPVEYTVKLHVTGDVPGCDNAPAATTQVKVKVYPQVLPISNVTAVIQPPCQTARITITNASENANTYAWTFTPDDTQNGQPLNLTSTTTATLQNDLVNNSTSSLITYSIDFRASRQWVGGPRCEARKTLNPIVVPPQIRPNVLVTNGDKICSDEVPRTFQNNTTGGAPDLIHEWHFGDGTDVLTTTNNTLVEHTFVNPTEQDVTYNVYVVSHQPNVSDGGCRVTSNLIPIVVHPRIVPKIGLLARDACASPMLVDVTNETVGSTAPTGVATKYEWDFGNGQRAEYAVKSPFVQAFENTHPSEVAKYTVKMKASQTHASSGKVCSATTTAEIEVLPKLNAQITVTPKELCSASDPVSFTATVVGGNNFTARWDFGDDMGSAAPVGTTITHVYTHSDPTEKDFTATYRVENEHGCVLTKTETIKVYPRPKASFTLNWTDQCTPYVINVTNNSSVGAHYDWVLDGDAQTFGDQYNLLPITVDNQTNEVRNLTLRLTVRSGNCTDVTSKPIVVPPRLVPEFQLSRTEGCNPVNVSFMNQSRGGTGLRYTWDLVDFGTTDEQTPADRTYQNGDKENDREIPIRLTVRNPFGCSATVEHKLTVWPKLDASFSATPLEGCSPLTVNYGLLGISTSSAYDYTWHIGTDYNGPHPPSQTYDNPSPDATSIKTTEVSLEVKLSAHPECSVHSSQTIKVFPRVFTEFDFTETGCHPLTVDLRSISKVYGSARYEWLVDGQSIGNTAELHPVLENPSHTTDKEFTVTLRATSEQGCTGEKEHKVIVWPKPLANFSFVGAALHCPPYDTRLDVSRSEGVNLTYSYDLGDGRQVENQETTGISHTYQNTQNSEISYQATLKVTTAHGCVDQTTQPIAIYPQVRAGFQFNPDGSGCSPFAVQMQNQSANADYYSWDFGDTSGDTKENPTHTFVNSSDVDRVFTVKLVARAQTGCFGEETHAVTVHATPHAAFSVSPVTSTFQDPDVAVTLVNQTMPASGTWHYRWSFGDGGVSQEQNPAPHLYKTWGDRAQGFQIPIVLTIDNGPCRDEVTNYITIRAPQSVADFTSDVTAGCPPLKVLFDDRESKYANSFEWDFGDGTTSTSRRPEHIFADPGKYNVVLTTKGDGGEHTIHKLIEVYRLPDVDFKYAPEKLQLPNATAQFLNLTRLGATYEWSFGDGSTSSEENPSHAYGDPGYYDVTLYARSEQGCEGTKVKKEYVYVSGAGNLEFPNAFSPLTSGPTGGYYLNEGERNQIFHPYNAEGVKEYRLMVFNRAGEQIFETTDLMQGWDGYYGSMLCPDGVYTWRAVGSYYDGSLFDMKGNVTLLTGK